jgi:hypothetical protein
MSHQENHRRLGRRVFAVSASAVVYFALLLVPHGFPVFGGTGLFFAYFLSLPVVLVVLLAAGVSGGAGLLYSRVRKRPFRARHREYVLVACVGLASFVLVLGLLRVLPHPLPTGSHLQPFDRAVWQDPRSAEYVQGDITPRQKMLADVVKSVLPGHTRAELEETLGPSLDTGYFKSAGRDLIYALGPQRDSFFAIDSEWLLIWLDQDSRFERYAIAND